MNDKKSKFGFGVLVGTVLGGLAAFFLSPQTGEENREMVKEKFEELKKILKEHEVDKKVKEIYGKASKEGKKIYMEARKEVLSRMEMLKEGIDDFDKDKYMEMVSDVVENIKKTTGEPETIVNKMKESLIESWNEMMTKVEKKAKASKMKKK